MDILLFGLNAYKERAKKEANLYADRVIADGGIVQDRYATQQYYEVLLRQFGTVPRRVYSALAGVKLNNVLGLDYVQTMYDMNNTSPVNAVQATAANQPLWGTDVNTSFRVPRYDGSNDFLNVQDLAIYRNRTNGTSFFICHDTNTAGGDANHTVLSVYAGSATNRFTLTSRTGGSARFQSISRRNDAGSQVGSGTINTASGFVSAGQRANWGSGGGVVCFQNKVISIEGLFTGLDTATSDTNSQFVTLGARTVSADRFIGVISEIILDISSYSQPQINALHDFHKQFYTTLP